MGAGEDTMAACNDPLERLSVLCSPPGGAGVCMAMKLALLAERAPPSPGVAPASNCAATPPVARSEAAVLGRL